MQEHSPEAPNMQSQRGKGRKGYGAKGKVSASPLGTRREARRACQTKRKGQGSLQQIGVASGDAQRAAPC